MSLFCDNAALSCLMPSIIPSLIAGGGDIITDQLQGDFITEQRQTAPSCLTLRCGTLIIIGTP